MTQRATGRQSGFQTHEPEVLVGAKLDFHLLDALFVLREELEPIEGTGDLEPGGKLLRPSGMTAAQ